MYARPPAIPSEHAQRRRSYNCRTHSMLSWNDLRLADMQCRGIPPQGGLREDIGMKTYLHGPMDYAKQLKLRFRVGDLTYQKEEIYIPVVGRRRTWLHICARVAQQ